MMAEGKRIPRVGITVQGRLEDEAIIQHINDFEKPIEFQTVNLRAFVSKRDTFVLQARPFDGLT